MFLLPFAVLFPAIGLGAWWGIWWVWFGKRDAGHTLKPGHLRAQSSPARLAPLAVTLVALFWNLVSWPVATLFVAQAGEGLSYWIYLVLLFPLIGLGLVYVAGSMWRARWRVGMPMLELMQAPAGGQFPLLGRVHFVPALGVRLNAAQLMHQVRIVVKMRQTVGSGDDTTESTLWENCVLDTSLARGAQSVDVSIVRPVQLQSPSTSPSTRVDWLLELHLLGEEICFDLPEAGPRTNDWRASRSV